MKKTVTAVVAGALFLTLAGCPKKADETVTTESTEVTTDVATAVTTDVDTTEVPVDSAS
jgi:PBP1b-binding outer membrane lipoprotein LpoB